MQIMAIPMECCAMEWTNLNAAQQGAMLTEMKFMFWKTFVKMEFIWMKKRRMFHVILHFICNKHPFPNFKSPPENHLICFVFSVVCCEAVGAFFKIWNIMAFLFVNEFLVFIMKIFSPNEAPHLKQAKFLNFAVFLRCLQWSCGHFFKTWNIIFIFFANGSFVFIKNKGSWRKSWPAEVTLVSSAVCSRIHLPQPCETQIAWWLGCWVMWLF